MEKKIQNINAAFARIRLASQKFIVKATRYLPFLNKLRNRGVSVLIATTIISVEVLTALQPYLIQHTYALGSGASLLDPISQPMAAKLKFDTKQQIFNFNQGYSPPSSDLMGSAGLQMSAKANQDASKGITVTDPVNQVDFTMIPKFKLLGGKQDGNRVVYPLRNGNGWMVYTMHAIGVKEDILLNNSSSDNMTLDYSLDLNGLQARVEKDGSIGIYGNTLLSGNVSVGSDKDSALLQKARQNAPKNTLLFDIPAPKIKESANKISDVNASYSLNGSDLQVNVTGLKKARYPLTIDPSIYVETAEKFMNGNNETNIDFDVADTLIQKGKTTGARFNSWDPTESMNTSAWRQGAVAAGGYIYTVGGSHPNGGAVDYTTPGNDIFTVPTGITSITVKMWGGGGGGGGGGRSSGAGDGAGAGFAQTTLSVTPGEALNITTGGGGGGGGGSSNSGAGGGGGGYSLVARGSTSLIVAAGGGGGGGGGRNSGVTGGNAGAGGGTSGVSGGNATGANGGGAGTASSGGSGGTGGSNSGSAGGSLSGGDGGDGRSSNGSDGGENNGGTGSGGSGGQNDVTSRYAGGGGGGSGYFGGGGGSGSDNSGGAGAGGGGSSYTSGTSSTNTGGSGQTPGNSSDSDRGTAGQGGNGAGSRGDGSSGTTGLVIITYSGIVDSLKTVNWAKFDTSSGAINDANPGNGTCSGWCTSTAYDLPNGRSGFSLVAYNGFLYAIGGESTTCVTANGTGDGNVCKTVYIAKLGANGEPRLWNPTSTNQNLWTYWYRDSDLTTPRSFTSAVAYNNRMYLLGGKTSSGGTPSITNTTQIADITATGTLGSWSTSTALPYNLYGHTTQVYNDRLYILGGDSSIGGSPLNSVYYTNMNGDGTLNSWIQTSSFNTARMTNGGNFTTVWGGYIYLSGGCTAVNGSGYCTNVASDTQLASINADGSLDTWNTDSSVSDTRMGQNLLAWRGYIYQIGGCSAQDGATGECTTSLNTINYGTINQDGDASTVSQSVASGTAPCSGPNPYNCNLPPAGTGSGQGGQMLSATAIINGYLYVVGGCSVYTCNTTSGNTSYSSIASDGTLTAPANCTTDGNTLYGAWCVDSTHTISGGVAAAPSVVFGGSIYVIGGLNGSNNVNTINHINVGSDGSLDSGGWTSQSLTGTGASNVSYEFAYSKANPSSASTVPGNLYIFGGCSSSSSAGCTAYSPSVYKCNINSDKSISSCSTSGQLQIGTIPGDTQPGLGIMAGAVYANYIYLIGGVSPNQVDLKTTRYAKFDNNNNVVAVSGSSWIESPNQTEVGRRRGAAFGYNGYIYVVGGYDAGSGVLADIEFAKVNVSDGSIGTFATSAVTINQRWGLSVPVSNSYAYVIGGCSSGNSPNCNNGGLQPVVQTFQIYNNDSGSPADYGVGANLFGTDRMGAGATIYNGYIYVAGGCTGTSDCSATTNSVQYAPIDANGSIGSWSAGGNLPASVGWGKLVSAGGSLYYVGGQNSSGTAQTAVYYTTGISSGNPSWSTASNGLPAARAQAGTAVWNDRIYAIGGNGSGTGCSGGVCNTVYVSPQLSSGGNISSAWSTTSSSFNVARSGLTAIAYANNLYLLGGYDGSNYLSDVQFAQISTSDGSIGSWSYSTSLPAPLSQSSGFAVNGYIYLFGGRSDDSTCTSKTLVAPISANTTIASGNHPTGVGDWYETNEKYTGDRYGAAAVYNDGKAYLLGGACGAPNPIVNSVTSTQTGTGFGSDSLTHNVNMPATTKAGDLLLMFFSYDDSTATITDPDGAGGWTQVTANSSATGGVTGSIWAKIATGSDGSTVNFASSTSQSASAQVYRIAANSWSGSLSDIASAVGTGSTTTTPNPPALTPSWGSANNLWLEYVAGGTHTALTTPSTNYANGTHTNGNTGNAGASVDTAYRLNTAATEDPGTMTLATNSTDIPFTIAVRPKNLTYTGSNEVQQTALLTQPQVAKYSIMFDTDTDVYPQKWLLNGVDNSIGAEWQLKYRSMKNITSSCLGSSMTTWGQETDAGNVTLGSPGTYTALDGSGTDTTCARFFYLSVTIDSSQTFGYPEDVSRGPTITDLTFEFTADPSKRLMHGRTFTGGLQQPDATPF